MKNINNIIEFIDGEWRSSHFLLTEGEIYEKANCFRQAFLERREYNRKKALEYGASSFVESEFSYKIIYFNFEDKKHPKFKLNKKRDGYVPAKKWVNEEEFSFFTQEYDEKFKPLSDFLSWLSAPTYVSFEKGGGFCIGNVFNPINLSFFQKDGPILLQVPDYEFYDIILKENGHEGIDFRIENNHTVEKILLEKWYLMEAEHKENLKKNHNFFDFSV